MGDVAMIVPVLKVFTKTYPEIHLTVLSRTFFKPLFEDLKNITFLEAALDGKHKGIKGLLRLYKKIKSTNEKMNCGMFILIYLPAVTG